MSNKNKVKVLHYKIKYYPELDDMLRQHLSQGLSFQAFAAVAKVNQDTLYQWVKKYPSFKAAKDEGTLASLLFWEKLGLAGVVGKLPGFNTATWIFNMKNRFGWRDRHEIKNLEAGDEFSEVMTHDKIMNYIEGKKF